MVLSTRELGPGSTETVQRYICLQLVLLTEMDMDVEDEAVEAKCG